MLHYLICAKYLLLSFLYFELTVFKGATGCKIALHEQKIFKFIKLLLFSFRKEQVMLVYPHAKFVLRLSLGQIRTKLFMFKFKKPIKT